jgi:cytochrome c biogenesis protein CcdA
MNIPIYALVIISYLGGILSIASPCSGLMLPLYFANTFSKKTNLVKHTLLFSLGALLFAIPLAVIFSYLLFYLNTSFTFFYSIFGALFIIFGVLVILGFGDKLTIKTHTKVGSSYFSSFILGLVASFSLGACTGPILGLILTVSGTQSFLVSSVLMSFYVLGIITPFILISFGVEKLNFLKTIVVKGKTFTLKNTKIHSTNLVAGVLFILVGFVFILYKGSSIDVYNKLSVNYDFMLTLQDRLIELFFN